jgi:hypothetical protein
VHPNISLLLHQNTADALEKKYPKLCKPSSFLSPQMLPTTSETTHKVQIRERKPIFVLHAPHTSPNLARNRKPIFAPNFEHLNCRAKTTNSKSSKKLEENNFISWFCREPPREKKSNNPRLRARPKIKL